MGGADVGQNSGEWLRRRRRRRHAYPRGKRASPRGERSPQGVHYSRSRFKVTRKKDRRPSTAWKDSKVRGAGPLKSRGSSSSSSSSSSSTSSSFSSSGSSSSSSKTSSVGKTSRPAVDKMDSKMNFVVPGPGASGRSSSRRTGSSGKEEPSGEKPSRRRDSSRSVALSTGRFAVTSSSSRSTSTGSRTYSSSSVGRGGSSPSRTSPSSVARARFNSSSSWSSRAGGVPPAGRRTPPGGRWGRYRPTRPHGARPSAGSRRRKPPLHTGSSSTSRGRGPVVVGARRTTTTTAPPRRRTRPKTPLRTSPKYTDEFKKWKGLVQGCNCDPRGSLGSTCDIVTGLCRCRNNVVGRTCSRCKDGYWGHASASGCLPCECDVIGSVTKQCDDVTGQCQCRPGVGGPRCDQCLPGYFGFSPRGCRACDVCESPGHTCDPDTGRCVCPHSTQGDRCDRCAPGSWGYDITRGCKPCNCSGPGSLSQQCDLRTGQCSCRRGFQGRLCDSCAFAHFGYPTCAECRCDFAGTRAELCDATTGRCQCDETGQCPCKANAEGRACGKCKSGTFGLAPDNRDGCTLCFCFRRSDSCTQAQLTWTQLALPGSRELTLSETETRLNVTNQLHVIPGSFGDVSIGTSLLFDTPLYWQLPQEFMRDKVLSYNGFLRFTVESKGGTRKFPDQILQTYPLVSLQGNYRLVLEHFAPKIAPDGRYEVRLHEKEWRFKHDVGKPVTREMMMIALQNLQHILIRATDSSDATSAVLKDVTLDIAAEGSPVSSRKALGVEKCICPTDYRGTSCQNPGIGFFRWFKDNYIQSTIIIDLVGESRPCKCGGRADTCDSETGHCQNCRENTAGPHCEVCASGYYGDPFRAPCRACACPTRRQNFAESCETDPLNEKEYICHCKEGYRGAKCDRCAHGYYGKPRQRGGSCQPCACDPFGSVDGSCNVRGDCKCRPGITGQKCSQCAPGHVVHASGCKSCKDGCVDVLQAEVQQMISDVINLNVSSFIPPPWNKLREFEKNVTLLRTNLNNYHSSIEVSRNLLVNFDLDYYAKDLLRKAEKLGIAAQETFPPTAEVKLEARDVLDLLLSLRVQLGETVAYLENYAIGETPSVSVGSALLEAEKILKELQRRDFSKFHRDAIRELKRSTKLLEHLRKMVVDVSQVSGLRAAATALEDKLLDLLEHIKQANQHTDKANFLNESNRERLARVREYSAGVKLTNMKAEEQHRNASRMLREARNNLGAAINNYENLEDLLLRLRNTSNYLEGHEGQIWRLNMEYRDKYVKATHDHAHDLMMESVRLESLFNKTRDVADGPLQAAQAYQRIKDALLSAELAAKNASAAAKKATQVAYPGNTDESLVRLAKQSLRKSQELHMKGEDLQKNVGGLSSQLNKQRKLLGAVQDDLNEGSLRIASLNNMMDMQLTSNITAEIQGSREEVTEALESINLTLGQVTSIHSNLTRIKTEALDFNRFDNTLLNEIREKIMSAEGQTMKGVRLATNIRKSADRIQNRSDDLRARIEALKRKIQQTRQYASSIRVSLTTDENGECVRKYRPDLRPSTTTSLSLAYAINSKAQDASILYLGSPNQSDFMAVEMLNRRIHFTWDVGGGPQKLIHPTELLTNDAGVTDDTRWYHIDIERIGNIGQLLVRPARLKGGRVGGGNRPQDGPVTAAAPPGFSKMDIRSDDSLWVGGFPESARRILKATSFAGCLHYVSLDGEKVGLWNFTNSRGCSACNEGFDLVTRQEDETAFSFNGKGYFRGTNRIRRPKDYFSVVLAFKTLDQDALLFLAVNPDKNQYFSLSLESGHVVFVVQFDAGTRLTMRSNRRLTTAAARADMTQIQAIVQNVAINGKRTGRLVVGDQDQVGTKKGGPDLDLASYPFYFGGVDPEFDKVRWKEDLTLRSLLGCMTGLRVLEEGKNPLTDGQSYGIENSCSKKPLKDVGFPGSGFVELPSHVLRRNSSFGFSFRTMEPNGLLMLSTFIGQPLKRGQTEHPKDFYSVSVVEGYLDIRLNAGEGSVRLLSNARFNDGILHSFFVLKANRKIRLLVDDTEVNSTRLDKGGTVVAGPDTGGLYFGGAPPNIDVREMVGSSLPLKGCIRDVIVNDHLVSFSNPLQFDEAFIGRCWDLPSTQMQSMEGHMKAKEACMPPTQHTVEYKALKFGDRADSHVMVPVPRATFKSDFNITFEFRTYYPNAIFFVAARIRKRKKSAQAVLAELRNGQVQVTLLKRGRRFLVSTTGAPFNTGTWHKVAVDKRRNRVRIYTGGAMLKAKVPAKLNVGSRLLLGGLPSPQHQLNSLQMTEPLRGCLRNINLNGIMYEIPSATRKDRVMGVGQCFAAVQPGSYFPGDAYAIYGDKFNVGSLLELQLEFRTWELNGVLLSVADPRGSALSLQMYDGQVVLSVHMGHSHQFQAQVSLHNKFVLCDNEWHTVKASYVKDSLTLRVDTHPEAYGFNGSTKGSGTETEAPLYIGGLPDSALRGTLSSRDNFKGCIRNVVLNSERRDWTDMFRLHGVLLNACPVQ